MSKSKRINEEIQERIQGRIDLGAKSMVIRLAWKINETW